MIIELGPYTFDVDIEKTIMANSLLDQTNSGCVCNVCQNFTPAIQRIDQSTLDMFKRFGLDPKRPSEVMEYDTRNGSMLCGGIYHIAGKIINVSAPEWIISHDGKKEGNRERHIVLSDSAEIWFTSDCVLVPLDFPEPVFQMEIYCKVPWVMDYLADVDLSKKQKHNVISHFGTLVEKRTSKGLLGYKFLMDFEVENGIIKLVATKDVYDLHSAGWYGIVNYRKGKLLFINDIKDK
ncbi:MAG: hypothetical protein HGB31_02585 [Erysipelotrichaceae bacterium]|nr:hypothetical protein [Erysipelotrichaceae bacterium]